MLYGSVGEQTAPMRGSLPFKRQALASVLAICAVTLMAASYAGLHAGQYRGNSVDLLEVVPINVPYLSASMLAQLPGRWNDNQVKQGSNLQQLAEEKTVVGDKLAKDMRKLWSAKSPAAEKQDKAKVETLRHRFESLISAMQRAPVLRAFNGPNGEQRAVGNGQVFQLYPYHVPGGYEDAPLDMDPAVPIFEKNPAGHPGNFADTTGRNPLYQGEYPAYAANQAPMLYGNLPVYVAPESTQETPEYFVVPDAAGQLRLVSPDMVQGMMAAQNPEQAEWTAHEGDVMRRMRAEIAQARRARLAAANVPSTEQLATVPSRLGAVVRQAWNGNSLKVQPAAARPAAAAAAPKQRKPAARKARKDPMLTDSGIHSYGTVYEPYLDARVNPAVGNEIENLRGPAKGFFDHYSNLATEVLNVRDPASNSAAGADWWTGPEAKENWWQHDHAGRGY